MKKLHPFVKGVTFTPESLPPLPAGLSETGKYLVRCGVCETVVGATDSAHKPKWGTWRCELHK
jgi:hypothetical protein